MRIGLTFWASAAALVSAAPAFAAPECLANGMSFQIGQTACLTLSGKPHLARCEVVLNNTSWTKIQDDCSQGGATPHIDAKPLSEPASPSATPTEPTEN